VTAAAPRPQWEGHTTHVRYAATMSPCGKFRYDLEREFDPKGPWVMFIGLNPSTADAQKDDPTIRREMDFGQGFGFPNLVKCNLYALRSTDPKGIRTSLVDPVGPDNDDAIRAWVPRVKRIVLAWGYSAKVGKRMLTRAFAVRVVLRHALAEASGKTEPPDVYCLGLTEGKERQPRHPLYLRSDTPWTRLDP
jgi:hypothetical protein